MSLRSFTEKDLMLSRISGNQNSTLNGRQLRRYLDKKIKKSKNTKTPYGIRNLLIANDWF